jgi:hypothetical protein
VPALRQRFFAICEFHLFKLLVFRGTHPAETELYLGRYRAIHPATSYSVKSGMETDYQQNENKIKQVFFINKTSIYNLTILQAYTGQHLKENAEQMGRKNNLAVRCGVFPTRLLKKLYSTKNIH